MTKKLVLWMIIFSMILTCFGQAIAVGAAESGKVIIKNGDFESISDKKPNDWTFTTKTGLAATIDTSNGTNALKVIDASDELAIIVYSYVFEIPQDSMQSTYKLQFDSKTANGAKPVTVGLRPYSSDDIQDSVANIKAMSTSSKTETWKTTSVDFVPSTTFSFTDGKKYQDIKYLRVILYTVKALVDYEGYFDNIKIISPGETATAPVSNNNNTLNESIEADADSVEGTTTQSTSNTVSTIKKTFSEPINLGAPLVQAMVIDSAYTKEDGHDVVCSVSSGNPGVFSVIDLTTKKLLRSFELNAQFSWSLGTDSKGTVYIATQTPALLYRYSPITKKLDNLGSIMGQHAAYHVTFDEDDNVYTGTYPDAWVVKYDVKTNQFSSFKDVFKNSQYVRAVAYNKGYVYAASYAAGGEVQFIKLNVKTGNKEILPIPVHDDFYARESLVSIMGAMTVRDYVFLHLSDSGKKTVMLVYDTKNKKWLDHVFANSQGYFVTPELNGKTYVTSEKKLWEFDLDTQKVTDTGIAMSAANRHSTWVEFNGNSSLPGKTLVTVGYALGKPMLYNLETKQATIMDAEFAGLPGIIQSIEPGEDNNIWIAGFMGKIARSYDVFSGLYTNTFDMGQSEGIVAYKGKTYFGVYPHAEIKVFDSSQPVSKSNPKQLKALENLQSRPYAMIGADDKIFIGTVAEYGEHAGALSIYDIGKDSWEIYRDVVKDQTVIGLAYKDGKIYGSTGIWGGLGAEPIATEAKIFVWDVANKNKINEVSIKIPGVNNPMKAIGDLSFGSDGLLWGVSKGVVFALEPTTLNVIKSKVIGSTELTAITVRATPIQWDKDGLLYVRENGITIVDPNTLDTKSVESKGSTKNRMVIGADNNIYYCAGGDLMKIVVSDGKSVRTTLQPKQIEEIKSKLSNSIALFVDKPYALVDSAFKQIDPNNTKISPIIKADRTFLPVRFLCESLGATVDWNEETQTVIINANSTKLEIVIGSNKIIVNNEERTIDVPSFVENDRTYLPLRALVESLGMNVFWDDRGLIVVNNQGNSLNSVDDKIIIDNAVLYISNYIDG